MRTGIGILHAENVQNFLFGEVAFEKLIRKVHGNHPVKLNVAFVNSGRVDGIFRRPDNLVRFVVQTEFRMGRFVGDPSVHVEPLRGEFGMTVEDHTAALSARIAHFVVDPEFQTVFFHRGKDIAEFLKIFRIGRKAVFERDVGDRTSVAARGTVLHLCAVILRPAVHHRADTERPGRILKLRTQIGFVEHSISPFL